MPEIGAEKGLKSETLEDFLKTEPSMLTRAHLMEEAVDFLDQVDNLRKYGITRTAAPFH